MFICTQNNPHPILILIDPQGPVVLARRRIKVSVSEENVILGHWRNFYMKFSSDHICFFQ
jgi:hypothetical protein